MLQNEMNGIQRVPALMYNDVFKSLEEVNLQNYELFLQRYQHIYQKKKKIYLIQQFTHHLMEKIENKDVIIELP